MVLRGIAVMVALLVVQQVALAQSESDGSGLVCPAVYLSCDGPYATQESKKALHEIASTIVSQHCFAQEAMRCFGADTAGVSSEAKTVAALRRQVAGLKRKIKKLQISSASSK